MKFTSVECPNCGADLENENGLDSFYCQYCGHHIILEGQSKATLKAKLRSKEIDRDERIKNKKIDKEERLAKERIKNEKIESIGTSIIGVLAIGGPILIVLLIFLLIFMPFSCASSEVNTVDQKRIEAEANLNSLVTGVRTDIENQKFDDARVKANQIIWYNQYDEEDTKKWDNVREELLDQIKKAEKEVNGSWWQFWK